MPDKSKPDYLPDSDNTDDGEHFATHRQLTARRQSFWKPILRPAAGRRLPRELRPNASYEAATGFPDGLTGQPYETLIRSIDQSPFHTDTRLALFTGGGAVFERMLSDIARATSEVLLEAYIIRDDQTGHDFLDALESAVKRGVDVKVLADSFGSSETQPRFWNLLKRQGSHVRLFRRPIYMPVSLLPIIDHRKLLIIDREIAYTGGMNIADEYRYGRDGERSWRDTHVRLHGGIAWEMVLLFSESWSAAGGDPLQIDGLYPADASGIKALVLDTRPGRGQDEVFSSFAATMGAARRQLLITNPYFAPGRRVLSLLKRSAARGVDVRLLLPGPSDLPIIRIASQGYYRELLSAGIRIFEYQHAVLHAKTVVADDTVTIVGSTNFDFRSFNFNAECNILVCDTTIAEQMARIFRDDLERSREITLAEWDRHPIHKRCIAWLARRIAFLM